jgi:hypothetical protein
MEVLRLNNMIIEKYMFAIEQRNQHHNMISL